MRHSILLAIAMMLLSSLTIAQDNYSIYKDTTTDSDTAYQIIVQPENISFQDSSTIVHDFLQLTNQKYRRLGTLLYKEQKLLKESENLLNTLGQFNADTTYRAFGEAVYLNDFIGDYVLKFDDQKIAVKINDKSKLKSSSNQGTVVFFADNLIELRNFAPIGEDILLYEDLDPGPRSRRFIGYRADGVKILLIQQNNKL